MWMRAVFATDDREVHLPILDPPPNPPKPPPNPPTQIGVHGAHRHARRRHALPRPGLLRAVGRGDAHVVAQHGADGQAPLASARTFGVVHGLLCCVCCVVYLGCRSSGAAPPDRGMHGHIYTTPTYSIPPPPPPHTHIQKRQEQALTAKEFNFSPQVVDCLETFRCVFCFVLFYLFCANMCEHTSNTKNTGGGTGLSTCCFCLLASWSGVHPHLSISSP